MYKKVVDQFAIIERMRDVLECFLLDKPSYLQVEYYLKCEDTSFQEWVCNNLKPQFDYATAYSVLNAAEDVAYSQIENGLESYTFEKERNK